MSRQRYISDELTHFIGRDLMEQGGDLTERDERLYQRLVAILREGRLLSGGTQSAVNADPSSGKQGLTVTVTIESTGSRNIREMFKAYVVCFCDIPVGDVAIHTAKYSPFGVAFGREFLLDRGTNPVLYLAEDAVVEDGKTYGELFSEELHFADQYLAELSFGKEDVEARRAHGFLSVHVFPLIQAFKARLDDEHPENFYMEREWRRYGDLEFSLEDVCRVYLPKSFAKRLREDIPAYYGQVTFAK